MKAQYSDLYEQCSQKIERYSLAIPPSDFSLEIVVRQIACELYSYATNCYEQYCRIPNIRLSQADRTTEQRIKNKITSARLVGMLHEDNCLNTAHVRPLEFDCEKCEDSKLHVLRWTLKVKQIHERYPLLTLHEFLADATYYKPMFHKLQRQQEDIIKQKIDVSKLDQQLLLL